MSNTPNKSPNPFFGFLKDICYMGLESIGLYYSSYLAVVSNVDDPENANRLKLIIPTITGQKELGVWAFPKNNYAGKGYGMQLLPRKGDIVRVEFEHGKANAPIWMHSHFAFGEKPTDDDLTDKECYWLITPNGHKVIINDTKNYLTIKDSLGNEAHFNDTGLEYKVADGKHINLGDNKQQAVLGNEAEGWLRELVKILQEGKIMTLMGPQPFMPDTQAKLITQLTNLPKILSKTVNLK